MRLLLLLALLARTSAAAQVLGLFQSVGRSQWVLAETFLRALEAMGHSVTVFTTFPSQRATNSSTWNEFLIPNPVNQDGEMNAFEKMSTSLYGMLDEIVTFGSSMCDAFLRDDRVQELYRSRRRFDVVIVETIVTECLQGFGHALGAPVVVLTSFVGMDWILHAVGNPTPYAYVPSPFLPYTSRMTFYQRTVNTVVSVVANVLRELVYLPRLDALLRTHLNDSTLPTMSEIEKQTRLLLVNYHFTHGCPRPLVPNMIEVGGLHIQPPKKLPEDIQAFLDEAEDGAIFFSMGSNVKSAHWPEQTRSALVAVFSQLKQRVLWKWELDDLPGQPPNVKIGKWLPQADILAHKNVVAFMTHGGLLSTQEATARGVPLLGIPVFTEQALNMAAAQEQGYAVVLDLQNITEQSLQWALNEVLNEPRYRDSVRRLSRVFNDRPRGPLEEAVFWTEYVIRHRGAPHLRSASLDLAWYQHLLLDVAAVALGATVLAALVVSCAARAAARALRAGGGRRKSTKRD